MKTADSAKRNPRLDATESRGMQPESLSILQVCNVLLAHRKLIVTTSVGLAAMVSVMGLLQKRTYTSVATFITQSGSNSASSLSGLAAQFGVAVPVADGPKSPQFYVDFVKTREIMKAVVTTKFKFDSSVGSQDRTLIEVRGGKPQDAALRQEIAIRALSSSVNASASLKTGVVTLRVDANQPTLAQQIAQRIIELVNKFNLESRQSHATAERKFIEQRLLGANDQLRFAEERLRGFLQDNRVIGSPTLSLEADRLRRDVAMRQQVYTTLAQAFEQAKIEEVRDSPVITVIDTPEAPVLPNPRKLISKGLMALLLGSFLGALLAFLRDFFGTTRAGESDAASEFARLWNDTKREVRHPLLSLKSWLTRRRGRIAAR